MCAEEASKRGMDALTREPAQSQTRPRLRRWSMVGLCLVVVVAIAYAIWFFPAAAPSANKHDAQAGQPIPVLTAVAAIKDVPLYQDGLGTVQAFYTVTMKAMVDGPLLTVNFKEGQDVHKGDLLAQIDPRTFQAALDSAVAKKAQDQAQLANARVDLARYQKLVANNYTSVQQADTAKAQVAQFEALMQQDQAQIDTARTQRSYTTIVSPIDGRTGIRQVDPGNIVHAVDTTGIVVITQLEPISVLFTLPQQALPAVAKAMADGNPQVLAQDASGGAAGLLDTGTLTVLDNQVDSTTGTIKLKAVFPNAHHRLWPGGFVSVRLRTDTAKGAVVVPPAAIQRGPRGPYVFVINGGVARRREINVGYEDEQGSIVSAGLKGGEAVVTEGASRLSDGSKVSVAKPEAEAGQGPEQPVAPGTSRDRGR
jgi:multidrug efflux system membrane fusion protein